jgi:hypothetical protein
VPNIRESALAVAMAAGTALIRGVAVKVRSRVLVVEFALVLRAGSYLSLSVYLGKGDSLTSLEPSAALLMWAN